MHNPAAALIFADFIVLCVAGLLYLVVDAARSYKDGLTCRCGHRDKDHDMTWVGTAVASSYVDMGKCRACPCRSFHRDYSA